MPESTPEAETHVAAADSGHSAEGHEAPFSFGEALAHHNMPYPAWEPIHSKPLLIFDLAGYAAKNQAVLEEDAITNPALAKGDTSGYLSWATDYATAHHGSAAPGELARAMVIADSKSKLGSFPRQLSWVNQQLFWGSTALILLALVLLVFARRKPEQHRPQGRIQHILEALVLFVRDDIVRPNIHHHPDAWVPHFASIFLAILACNLIGLIPGTGTATGNIAVTSALAVTTLLSMLFFGMKEQGVVRFWINLVPVPFTLKPAGLMIWLMLAGIELLGLLIKPVALAIRLFANMFAGHSVLLAFCSLGLIIHAIGLNWLALGMTGFGTLLAFAIFFLELLVACIQAYVFTLLSAVFIGSSMHPEH